MLQDAQRTCAPSADERLDEHGGLDGHVQRAGDPGAGERLRLGELAAHRHQAGHLVLGELDLLAPELGERQIGHLEVALGERARPGLGRRPLADAGRVLVMKAPVERCLRRHLHLTRVGDGLRGAVGGQRTGRSVMDGPAAHVPPAPCIPPVWFPRTLLGPSSR